MLNQAVIEALYSATYIENYLDCVENLPNDLQRHVSRLRELDATCQSYLRDVDQQQDILRSDVDMSTWRRALLKVQQALIAAQEIGDEKLQIVQQVQDHIENKSRQLDLDYRNLDFGKEQEAAEPARDSNANVNAATTGTANTSERQTKRTRRPRNDTLVESAHAMDIVVATETRSATLAAANTGSQKKAAAATTGKKKKRRRQVTQQSQHREDTPPPPEDAIDPDEPTYCLCDQISYGEMILCDNDLCPIEWFHFSCVSLSTKPKGKWFCPKCRGDRPNVMKPKAQFLKELERYNKEKEEKS
ncbi:inhibitor of growth protein 1 [Neodiprion pinetum]|uniref:Inhibitor of growth protein n=1 Tax=Neodiprion lecontei TaxID=441921 RepID=A0A6J0BUB4_NEOLC|nr:inhibitor of growth protein 1 [Neodiprion lecontei]XP_046421593.1 inhibitor of growth protein 1 [Neodiprion fabricii]XP_046478035.1 inhibitor of growth protein 1 [Neodiprion pinetum]XP_046615533.1 inhibitor of growth protein 1 [Neodiprion virginianus]